jgi:hypothetical protein
MEFLYDAAGRYVPLEDEYGTSWEMSMPSNFSNITYTLKDAPGFELKNGNIIIPS